MIAILSYRMEHDCHTLLLKSATKRLKMGNSLPHFLLKTAILSFYLQDFKDRVAERPGELVDRICVSRESKHNKTNQGENSCEVVLWPFYG